MKRKEAVVRLRKWIDKKAKEKKKEKTKSK